MTSEMRVTFQEELQQIEAALQEEGDYVLRALRATVNALEQADPELADEVIAFDDEIDNRYFTIQDGISRCWRVRPRSPSTCASSSRCCTPISTSSEWATTASRSR